MVENNKPEFYFVFYNNLDKLLEKYMKLIRNNYSKKSIYSILGQINSEVVRDKYLLNELEDKDIATAIVECITSNDKTTMLDNDKKSVIRYLNYRIIYMKVILWQRKN